MELRELGITAAKEKQFNKKKIYSVSDLVEYFPRKYLDLSKITGILPETEISCFIMTVNDVKLYNNSTPLIIASGVEKGTGNKIKAMWFRKQYMFNSIHNTINNEVYVCGKAVYSEEYKNYSITEPNVFTAHISQGMKIYPIYSKIPGMSTEYMQEHIRTALGYKDATKDLLPLKLVNDEDLMPNSMAINELHNPTSMSNLEKAQNRMMFNDLLYFAGKMEENRRLRAGGSSYNIKTLKTFYQILDKLPYKLTDDQEKTVMDIIEKMRAGKVRGLIQGNVGSGKTLVAELCMIAMADNGYQSLLMAPTKILAKQHYDDMSKLVKDFDLHVAFYQGTEMKASERKQMLKDIKSGYYDFIIGTNGVLSKDVEFKELGLAILDEEHKYGSCLKDAVYDKATNSLHTLLMSATPIPRSIASVLYGDDIQLYNITTMPSNRKEIQTYISNEQRDVFNFIWKQVKMGHQAYVVCPIIDQSEKLENVASIEEMSELYKTSFEPLGMSVDVLTGRDKKEEAEYKIEKYKRGETDILLCSQIIEVGVSNQNSTVIVIHSPDRLGVASLHQIRGRVGRGEYQSYCILYTDDVENERLKMIASTTDGYKIALYDLQNRKPGDLIGTQQSGENKYVELMLTNQELYKHVKSLIPRLLDTGEIDEFMKFKDEQTERTILNKERSKKNE